MKTIAIVLASGTGNRFDKNKIKQYQPLNNESVIYHSVNAFINNPNIYKVIVVINKKHINLAKIHLKKLGIESFVFGGATRQESVFNALKYIKKFNPLNVLIHDSARPNVNKRLINFVFKKLKDHNSVIPITKINDSLKKASNNKVIKHTNRDEYGLAQTPQGFKYKDLFLKHESNKNSNISDDSSLFDNVHTINGDAANIKITNKEDLEYLQFLMSKKKQYIQITGLGTDVHKFDKVKSKSIRLGGLDIKFNKSLLGHSDADVVLHALVDSILGTISEGDIGSIFSNKNPEWKNANSEIFVNYANALLKKHNCILAHTDITIICEEPKITPHRKKIKKNISKLLNISEKCVSIKATTSEGLGFTGRKEGIMAQCITTISKPII